MANLKRLTDRVISVEKWIEENGDGDNMANMHYLIRSVRQAGELLQKEQNMSMNFKQMVFAWMKERELGEDWDAYVQEQQDALQKQQAEEVPVQEQAESSEEAIEEEE